MGRPCGCPRSSGTVKKPQLTSFPSVMPFPGVKGQAVVRNAELVDNAVALGCTVAVLETEGRTSSIYRAKLPARTTSSTHRALTIPKIHHPFLLTLVDTEGGVDVGGGVTP